VVTEEEVAGEVEAMRKRGYERGARVVARAWVDPEYKKRLLANGTEACEELGLEIPALKLLAVENTPEVHNAIVCTLLLLSADAPRHPARVVQVAQLPLAHGARASRGAGRVRARDSRAGGHPGARLHRGHALSRAADAPGRTEGWSEERLASLVTRDSMIGVAVPKVS
jgi:nitrile hydratase